MQKQTELILGTGLALPSNVVTEKLAILAQSGAGKSYTGMRLAELMLSIFAQIVVLDPMGIWWSLAVGADGKAKGYPVYIFGGVHGHFPLQPEHGSVLATLVVQQQISVVLDLSDMDDEEIAQFVTDFVLTFRRLKKGKKSAVHVFYEEAHNFAPRQPESKPAFRMKRAVVKLVKEGRGSGIGCTLISQQPQDLETAARNQAGTLIAMRALGPHERKAIREWVGQKGEAGEVNLDGALRSLGTGEAYVWSPVFLQLNTPLLVRISKRETFDASATPEVGEEREEPTALQPKDMEEIRRLLTAAGANLEGLDPEILRERIAKLERDLAEARAATPAPVLPVPPPAVVSVEELEVLRARVEDLTTALGKALEAAGPVSAQGAALLLGIQALLDRAAAVPHAPMKEPQVMGPVALPVPKARATPSAEGSLSLCARKILSTMSAAPGKAWERMELGVRTVYAYDSGNFSNALSELRSKGLLSADRLELTEAGRAHASRLAPHCPPLTDTQVLVAWKGKLGSLAGAMLEALRASYPHGLLREDLGVRVKKEHTGGYFSNALSELSGPGLIEKSSRSHSSIIRLSSVLVRETWGEGRRRDEQTR